MLEILNMVMRFFTWGFATYRWEKRNERFMFFLSLGLWMDFLGALVQKHMVSKLNWNPNLASLLPLLSFMAVVEGILMVAASFSIREQFDTRRNQLLLLICVIGGPTYVLLATLLNASATIFMVFPIPFTGLSLMYLGYSLIKEEVGLKTIATLFPIGAFLLGLINLTYPVTIKTHLAGYFYGLGAAFRAMMFIGMFKYAVWPIKPPKKLMTELRPGAFYADNTGVFEVLVQKMQSSGNGILITRNPLKGMKPRFPVFWVTRATSGQLDENIIAISPTDIGILIDLIKRYLRKGHSLVVIDCFEYLMMENGFESSLKFLLSLKDTTVKYDGTLITIIETSAYPKKHLAMLRRELERLEL